MNTNRHESEVTMQDWNALFDSQMKNKAFWDYYSLRDSSPRKNKPKPIPLGALIKLNPKLLT